MVASAGRKRRFSAETRAQGAKIAQHVPHRCFGLGHFSAEFLGALSDLRVDV
ncbi:hypothetical protein AOX55_00002797 [Sinorhizobium fredii CCBAU 25509]|nr:hypothetical protein AOX55_00002797 [Sinorhizobium fredii CCBAU 25509]